MGSGDEQLSSISPLAIIGAILAVIALLTGAGALVVSGGRDSSPPVGVHYLDPPQDLGDFSLLGPAGQEVWLSDFHGQPILLLPYDAG